ncbi:AraC family transcriptional regulator [Ferrimonas sp. SCSIO 43195]|uniref:AraC family transcriptional regulator n=1 Tax=Ferrimonas sp. SCSIO 43195 TaxID=2822844 RepID=UPI002076095C|nr:AraC family transcriptional regulator [Ferrimonas sp. SCSIO 43195]USD36106.1 AraC family transcriptional regulator ligand-binding domain-containing protein [Ferrimonas sp. SCSIO 43195]
MTRQFQIRVSALAGIEGLIQALGGDSDALLATARLTRAALEDEHRTMAIDELANLLQRCAEALNCPDFGLRLGAGQDFAMLGGLGAVLQHSTTPQEALKAVRSLMAFHNQSEYWNHELQGQLLAICRYDNFHAESDSRQYKELAMSACFHLCQRLMGPTFRAARLDFSHAPQQPLEHYRKHFQTEVMFNQPQDILWLPATLLTQRLHRGDAIAKATAEQRLQRQLQRQGQDRVRQVSGLIQQTLGAGQANIDHIAALLGLHRRTLQRQLAAEQQDFSRLLQQIRMQSACWQLRYSAMDITLLAEILGYRDLSNFSRAFRKSQGLSPQQWRRQHRE